jgi:hypothetical protein
MSPTDFLMTTLKIAAFPLLHLQRGERMRRASCRAIMNKSRMRKELGSGDVACKSYTRFGLG